MMFSPVMYFDYYSYKYFLDNKEPLPLLLLGADLTTSELGWDCGACGFETCAEFNVYAKENKGQSALWGGPTCNWKLMDFAAACDFACAAVAQYRFDGRIMGTVGAAAANVAFDVGTSVLVTGYDQDGGGTDLRYRVYPLQGQALTYT